MTFGKGLKKGFKSSRKFGSKVAKGASFGLKKASSGANFVGEAMVKAGEKTNNQDLVGAGNILIEGGKIAGMAGSTVEKLRTIKTSDDAADVISGGFAVYDKSNELYRMVQ